jgi:hypothetical protein
LRSIRACMRVVEGQRCLHGEQLQQLAGVGVGSQPVEGAVHRVHPVKSLLN